MDQVTPDPVAPDPDRQGPRPAAPDGWRFAQPWPCTTCPFRTDVPFYLDYDRAAGIAEALNAGRGFTCHKTAHWGHGGEWQRHDGERQCGGALATMLADAANLPDGAQLAQRLGLWDPAELAGAPVPAGLAAWLAQLAAHPGNAPTDPKGPE